MKKGQTELYLLIFVVLIAALIYLWTQGTFSEWMESNLRINSGESNSDIITNNYYSESTDMVESYSGAPDLRDIYQPFIVAWWSGADSTCISAGGSWKWQADMVGCKDILVPAFDCSDPAIQMAMAECRAVGGNDVCDPWNAYCIY